MQYGLIGGKLGHSFSPIIHGNLSSHPYELKELAPDELAEFFARRDFVGVNVTIPYKSDSMQYLDEIDPIAREIGAVNTVVNRDGRLIGYNTDVDGICAMMARACVTLANKKVLILGTGGTSQTAQAVAKSAGAREVLRVSRTGKDGAITYEMAKEYHTDADVIINTTPVGMYPHVDGLAIDIAPFTKLSGVLDVVYNPLVTPLLREAEARGIPASGGLYMLVAQAVRASEYFVGARYPAGVLDDVYTKVYNAKQTIYLIGMPASGKSTIGAMLAEALGRPFIDLDVFITEKYGATPEEIIRTEGEAAFRDKESDALYEVKYHHAGAVVATGGGAILREDNRRLMQEGGRVVFLDRSLDLLIPTSDRPTASTKEAMAARYAERYAIYRAVAHHIIPADGTPREVLAAILEDNKI